MNYVFVTFPDGVVLQPAMGLPLLLRLYFRHPLALVTVTVKVPAVDTFIGDVVYPVDHRCHCILGLHLILFELP